jgi:hypothetical protein
VFEDFCHRIARHKIARNVFNGLTVGLGTHPFRQPSPFGLRGPLPYRCPVFLPLILPHQGEFNGVFNCSVPVYSKSLSNGVRRLASGGPSTASSVVIENLADVRRHPFYRRMSQYGQVMMDMKTMILINQRPPILFSLAA